MAVFLVVGLGNPGIRYDATRHNVGFMSIDRLAKRFGVRVGQVKHEALIGEARIGCDKVILAKPQTYMNHSGIAVAQIAHFYKIDPERIIILCDDIDIKFGTVRVRASGSAGTHNGLKSIVGQLGTGGFPRVKLAVGACPPQMALSDFVLSRFDRDELKVVEAELEIACDAVEIIIREDVTAAMNRCNGREVG